MAKEYQSLRQIIEKKLIALKKNTATKFIKQFRQGQVILEAVLKIESQNDLLDEEAIKKIKRTTARKEEEQFATFSFQSFKEQALLERYLNELIQKEDRLSFLSINVHSLKNNIFVHFQIFINTERDFVYYYAYSKHLFSLGNQKNPLLKEKIESFEKQGILSTQTDTPIFSQAFRINANETLEILPNLTLWLMKVNYNITDDDEVQLTTQTS